MSNRNPVIVWFRQDLRLADNPALEAAIAMQAPILPVYVLDDENAGDARIGAAGRWWLHRSLGSLNASLDDTLLCLAGDAASIVPRLARNVGAEAVFWNRCYEPWRINRDKRIKSTLRKDGKTVRSFNGSLLFEPPNVTKKDGSPYKVFTPYYQKGCLKRAPAPRKPSARPSDFELYRERGGETIDDLGLMPNVPWHEEMDELWRPGEDGAHQRLDRFLTTGLADYADGRDFPGRPAVSRLSPHLHFGEISPHTVWHAVSRLRSDESLGVHVEAFLRELGWREFSYYLLYYFPLLQKENLQRKFDAFPWLDDEATLALWQRGATGYPIVDAGMRELWRTGYMHNRVRMITGSFLVKNLLLDWRHGEAWFRDTLVDHDLASNSAGWQWIAGCGADAAPYFRIFNPVSQGRKFDADGDYVRRYLPELAELPTQYLHSPWEAPADVLRRAGVRLGVDYPQPVVDLAESRHRALDAFRSLSAE